jgi:hypothetical protein
LIPVPRLISLALLLAIEAQPAVQPPTAHLDLERHSPAVRDGRLVEDVGIETLGGVFTVLLPRDQAVPVAHTETFSTAADNQEQIEIRLFRGVASIARNNTRVGRFVVDRIPTLPRGAPKVAVTFSVTADGAITVAASERSGQPVGLRLIPEPGVQSFDCTSADEMKRGESLRARHSGGPEGATWNWYGADLLCTVVVRGACDGTARIVMELGRMRAAQAAMTLSQRDATTQELRVPAKVWERALQRRRDRVYETLALRLRVVPTCAEAARRSPRLTWSDSFIGAFSGGE